MDRWVVERRSRRRSARRELGEQLGIPFQQGVDGADHLPRDAPDDGSTTLEALGAFVEAAFLWQQSGVDVRPLALRPLDGVAHDEKHHLLHGARARAGLFDRVQRLPTPSLLRAHPK